MVGRYILTKREIVEAIENNNCCGNRECLEEIAELINKYCKRKKWLTGQ